ncbi:hypothetical protein FGO68_gene6903 [Halteria grandinella]|uniref:Uncharacterized protein n=1 Tax=Halteria grandinella TaxID=5974 RepID=A0A8J8NAN6_HALGN|nr:hypothetical protein FGO68_gene6903 [Halteria grandinella]
MKKNYGTSSIRFCSSNFITSFYKNIQRSLLYCCVVFKLLQGTENNRIEKKRVNFLITQNNYMNSFNSLLSLKFDFPLGPSLENNYEFKYDHQNPSEQLRIEKVDLLSFGLLRRYIQKKSWNPNLSSQQWFLIIIHFRFRSNQVSHLMVFQVDQSLT